MWVPQRYTEVKTSGFNDNWMLLYNDGQGDDDLCIVAWTINTVPSVDLENMKLIEETQIQNGQAMIYSKEETNTNMLLWTVNDYIIQVMGDATTEEIEKIAENFLF